ncbi:reverse transcriptase domain-containing protein [Tanacetum coccineum]
MVDSQPMEEEFQGVVTRDVGTETHKGPTEPVLQTQKTPSRSPAFIKENIDVLRTMIKEHDQQAKMKATPRKLAYVDFDKEAPAGSLARGFSERFSLESFATSNTHKKTCSASKSRRTPSKNKEPPHLRKLRRLEDQSITKEKARRERSKPKGKRSGHQESLVSNIIGGPNSLRTSGFEELSQKFLEELSQQKRYAKDPTEIHGIKRRQDEGLQDFMDRFKSESSYIKGVPSVLRISAFVHGHAHPELANKINDKIPKKMDEMFERVRAFIKGEVVAGSAEMVRPSQGDKSRLQIVIDKSSAGKHGCIRMGRIRKNSCSTICHGESTKDPFAEPVVHKRRPMTPDGILILKENMFRWLKEGMIRKVWHPVRVANTIPIKLANGTWKVQVDYSSLNKVCAKDIQIKMTEDDGEKAGFHTEGYTVSPYAERIQKNSAATLQRMMEEEYNQIKMTEDDEEKTRFHTKEGVYCFTHMPKELKNTAATLQRMMKKVLADQRGRKEKIEEGLGVGTILVSLEEKMYSYAFRLKFNASNHAMDCEALLAGLAAFVSKGIKDLHVFMDSLKLVAQTEGNHTPATEQERKYKKEIMDATAPFYRFWITHLPKNLNSKAEVLTRLATIKLEFLNQEVSVGIKTRPSVEETSSSKKGKAASKVPGAKPNYNWEDSGSN